MSNTTVLNSSGNSFIVQNSIGGRRIYPLIGTTAEFNATGTSLYLIYNNRVVAGCSSSSSDSFFGDTIFGSGDPTTVFNALNLSIGNGSGDGTAETGNSSTSNGFFSTAVITRADTSGVGATYIKTDVYGSTFELTNIGIAGGHSFITNIDLIFNINTLPVGMGAFSVYLFNSIPSNILDNDAFSLTSTDLQKVLTPGGLYLGVAKLAVGGGAVVLSAPNINLQIPMLTTSVWGRLITHNSFIPAVNSETTKINVLATKF